MRVNVVNPELVVVGGDLAQAGRVLLDPLIWLRGLCGPMRANVEDEICEGDNFVGRVRVWRTLSLRGPEAAARLGQARRPQDKERQQHGHD
jgi:hypothetical protein